HLPPDSKSSRTASNGLSQPEYCEDYPHIVTRLGDSRVIESGDRIQWIIQTHCPNSTRPWRNKYYCRSKVGLLRFLPNVPEILALRDYFPDAAGELFSAEGVATSGDIRGRDF